MPVTVEQVGDEPIILVTVKGHLDVEIAKDTYRRVAEIADTIEGKIIRITDVREQETTFPEMIEIVKKAAGTGMAGSASDKRIMNVFVGRDAMARVARDLMSNEQHGGVQMPMFHTMEDAMQFARMEIARQKSAE
ncbi:MAG: hypothetical protein D6737_08630 [Chloroflexi bacterium]|nr:MAG: hypothetical protein D6737_08630 [Chloroflexota bacterium]